jgi:zinc/manganese transport system substrate-binding protein
MFVGHRARLRKAVLLAAAGLTTVAAGGCASSTGSASNGGATSDRVDRVVEVTAAENFWGSIAAQIGGDHAHVVSIITNPNTDPHAYEPTAADARTLARSQLVIENGIGYDPWVPKLLGADQGNQTVLDVGTLLGVPDGSNPHRWYDPADVPVVTGELATDLGKIDPTDAGYFERQREHFDTVALAPYHAVISAIRSRYSGTPVGASESIFAMLAPALGLDLITPGSFLRAISEGTDVSVADKETIDRQIRGHRIDVYVYNSQNVTPDVQTQLDEAKAGHIPVATITETLQPAHATFQSWQTRQLLGIEAALARAALALASRSGQSHHAAPGGVPSGG